MVRQHRVARYVVETTPSSAETLQGTRLRLSWPFGRQNGAQHVRKSGHLRETATSGMEPSQILLLIHRGGKTKDSITTFAYSVANIGKGIEIQPVRQSAGILFQ